MTIPLAFALRSIIDNWRWTYDRTSVDRNDYDNAIAALKAYDAANTATLTIPTSVHNAAWEAWERAIATPGAHVFAEVVGPVYEAWERAAWQIPATRLHDHDCAVNNMPAMPPGLCDCGAVSFFPLKFSGDAPAKAAAIADDLIRLAIDMRDKQKTYFRTRDRGALEASKAAEREFDGAAKAWAKPGLFE